MNVSLVARADSIARCALCHDDALDAPLLCPDCHTVVHAECRVRAPCPTLGCRWARRPEAEPARERVVFLRPSALDVADSLRLVARLCLGLIVATVVTFVVLDITGVR